VTTYNIKFQTITPGYWLKSGSFVVEGEDIKVAIQAVENVLAPSIVVTSVTEVMG